MIINLPNQPAIYHYTTFKALESILRGRSLWLSHNSCLNDISEGVHGVEAIFSAMENNPENQKDLEFLDKYKSAWKMAVKDEGFYVISFCEEKDALSQWRAYANEGCGIAIGVDLEYLKRSLGANEIGSAYIMSQCGYTEDQYSEIFAKMYTSFKSLQVKETPLIIGMAASFLKHDAFRIEREIRIVAGPGVNTTYRDLGGRIIPYHVLDLANDYSWLKEIVVGPCVQQTSIKIAIMGLLNELKAVRSVSCSNIPFRGIKYYS